MNLTISQRVAIREIFLIALILLSGFLSLLALIIVDDLNYGDQKIFPLVATMTGAIGFFILSRVKKNPNLANRISTLFAIIEGAFFTSLLFSIEKFSHDLTESIFVILMIQLGSMIFSSIFHGIFGFSGRFIDSFIVIFGFGFCNLVSWICESDFITATQIGVTLGILCAILTTNILAENFRNISRENDPWFAAFSLLTLAKFFPLNYNPRRS